MGLFWIVAGVVYVLWQYHKECPGGIWRTALICGVPLGFFYLMRSVIGDLAGPIFCTLLFIGLSYMVIKPIVVAWREEKKFREENPGYVHEGWWKQ